MGAGSEDGTIPLASVEEAEEDSMMSPSSHTCVRKMKLDDFNSSDRTLRYSLGEESNQMAISDRISGAATSDRTMQPNDAGIV